MLARAELEAVTDGLVGRGPHLVRPPAPQQLLPAEGEPHVRAEVLVRRADEHVAAPRRHVDRPVRAVVHGVDPRERAGLVRELDDPADVGRGADRVRGGREGDDLRPRRALGGQVVEIEREVVVDVDEADDDADVLGEREPRRDVPVVVEPRDEHLVAGLELAGERTREEEVESGHALPERDLAGIAAEERGGTLVRGSRPPRPSGARSRTARRRSRCPRAGTGRSRRSPRRGTASHPGRRRTRAGGRGR